MTSSLTFSSFNPATGDLVWKGSIASQENIESAITQAESAQKEWGETPFEKRADIARQFASLLDETFAHLISEEMGKPFWESKTEVEAMRKKVDLSIKACNERCPTSPTLHHKPHGVGAVFGPFNFPGHLPNGHIVPLLLAGNCLLFKPSELTPAVGEKMGQLWQQAGLPQGVFTLLQGGPEVGKALVENSRIKGIYFTGSYEAGRSINEKSLQFPHRIVALEMGGNNPLIVNPAENLELQVLHTIQSAYITSGQRCSCARRLIVLENSHTQAFLDLLLKRAKALIIAPYTMNPEPFMGPLVNKKATEKCLRQYEALIAKGAKVIMPLKQLQKEGCYLSPALLDCTGIEAFDEEIFGPVLQLFRVQTLDEAICLANHTDYGLTAAILTEDEREFQRVLNEVQAGVINWNAPTTGASSAAPFGGIGKSGNFHPSAYWAADYASYPVASTLNTPLQFPQGYPHVQ